MDWYSLLIGIIGAFIGAILGCLFGLLSSWILQRRAVSKLKDNLRDELEYIEKILEGELESLHPIIFPIDAWDVAKSSSVFIHIIGNKEYCKTIKGIYYEINHILSIEESRDFNNEIDRGIVLTERKRLIKSLNGVLGGKGKK